MSCSVVGPNFESPQARVSKQWATANLESKNQNKEWERWWEIFSDPVLDNLIELSYKQNLSLKVSGVRVMQSRARLAAAIGDYYPQVQQALGSYGLERNSRNAPGGDSLTDVDYAQGKVGFGASWELDFWGKFRRAVESEDASLLASMASYDNVLVSVLAEVANTYVVIRVLEKQLEVAKENVKIQKESFSLADARFKGGATGERDVQQALSQLYNTEASIPDLERSLQQAKNALAILLGMAPAELNAELVMGTNIPLIPKDLPIGVPADILRRRPDIRIAEMQAATQCYRIGMTEAELYPAFSLGGSIGLASSSFSGNNLGEIVNADSRFASFSPSFTWNIFNYGQIRNAIRLQDALFQESLFNYQDVVIQAQREVEDSLVSFVKTKEAVISLDKAATAARKTLILARIQYDSGATDYTTVINAQAALLQQEDALVRAKGALPQSLIAIYRALGGGWEIRGSADYLSDEIKSEMKDRTDWGGLLDTSSKIENRDSKEQIIEDPWW